MRASLFAALLLLLSLAGLPARAQAVQCRALDFHDKRYTVCEVDLAQEKLRPFLRDSEGNPFKGFDALKRSLAGQGEQLLFAMNAGMYHPDYSPVGLFVADGKEISPLSTASGEGNFFLKPNGVFFVTQSGAGILETSRYAQRHEPVLLATQSGPMLLEHGEIHPRFIPASDSLRVRNGVGLRSPSRAVFAISDSSVNFYEFAGLFRDALGCKEALYFDGSISSLYSAQLQRNDNLKPLGPIIGVTRPMR
ncbi:MAG TPA: phosphodiester glycosidase family protein [Burkholderiales bacterium]|nr:phosphodiester glycosidase family protein [Burkholderiales bacterium]